MGLSPALGNSCVPMPDVTDHPYSLQAPATSSFQRSAASAKAQTLLPPKKKPLAGPIAQLLSLPVARVLACAQAFQKEEGEWNSVCIAVLVRMVLRSRSSNSRNKEVVVLLVTLVVAEGAPAFDRDLLNNQVCQFQVSKSGQSLVLRACNENL